MLVLITFLLLAVPTWAANHVSAKARVPGLTRSVEIPDGLAEGDIVWSNFDSYLAGFQLNTSPNATYTNTTAKGLADLTFNGTVEYVTDELKGMGYPVRALERPEFFSKMSALDKTAGELHPPTTDRTRKCREGGVGEVYCYDLWDGATYLAGLGDGVMCRNEARTCGRISCSWSSAIWWCNNNYHPAVYPCNIMAFYAWEVYSKCGRAGGDNRMCWGWVRENVFNFRVIVGKSSTWC